MQDVQSESRSFSVWRAIGPALITASVVLGPGSILSASKIGYQHGYAMVWVLVFAVFMMIGMTALSARLGVLLDGTLCEELHLRAGRWAAAITGVSLFLIAACFQFGNNLGVLAAMEPLFPEPSGERGLAWQTTVKIGVIGALNVAIIVALFGFKRLYTPVERLMKILVSVMIIGFAANLILARPDVMQVIAGLVPSLPEGALETLLPKLDTAAAGTGAAGTGASRKIVDNLTPIIAMFATTFSIGGAFYQSYLVRKKGWTTKHLREGVIDSTVGISVLGLVTLMIMVTAASVLHARPDVGDLNSAADVARQLSPLFGKTATVLFCLGIFAGAFSSFLVNAMIGGTILSDGLGLGGDIDGIWPKAFTVLALMVGMGVAVFVQATGEKPVNLIIFAQAMTVLGLPALALAMLYLGTRKDLPHGGVPLVLKLVAALAVLIVVFLALRTGTVLYLSRLG